MKLWPQRTSEEANLLNPAFCCVSLASSVVGYVSINQQGLPYPLAFLLLPIVLHKPTRELLPRDIRTSLAAWLQENASARILFSERAISLKPHTREAILFGFLHNWFTTGNDGYIQTRARDSDITRYLRTLEGESRECVMRARFVGRWFASAGSAQTVMALWGVRP